jgi:DNA-directed RNA polymerase
MNAHVRPESSDQSTIELFNEQAEREFASSSEAVRKFKINLQGAFENGNLADHRAGQYAIRKLIGGLLPRMQAEFDSWKTGNPRRAAIWKVPLREMDPAVVLFEALHVVLDSFSRDNREVSFGPLADRIGKHLIERQEWERFEAERPQLVQQWRDQAKTLGSSYKFQRTGWNVMLNRQFEAQGYNPYDPHKCGQIGAILLGFLEEQGVITTEIINMRPNKGSRSVSHNRMHKVQLSDLFLKLIFSDKIPHFMLQPKKRLMVSPPLPWRTVNDGGYQTTVNEVKAIKVSPKRFQSLMVENDERSFDPVAEALDYLGSTAWRVNPEVLAIAERHVELELSVGSLKRTTPLQAPSFKDFPQTAAGLERFKKEAKEIHDWNRSSLSQRIKTASIINEAKANTEFDRLWSPFQIDKRGRMYAVASNSVYGNDLSRALLMLAEGQPLDTPEAVYWHKVQGANLYGHDKLPFDERVAWVDANVENILRTAEDPMGFTWWHDADAKHEWRFLAWCLDFERTQNGGLSHILVHQDATSSGYQIFNALVRSKSGCELVNMTPSEHPNDFYSQVASHAMSLIKAGPTHEGEYANWSRQWIIEKPALQINRKQAKEVLVPWIYGGTHRSHVENIMVTLKGHHDVPSERISDLAVTITHALERSVAVFMPEAVAARSWLVRAGRQLGKLEIEPVLSHPDGFKWVHSEREQETVRITTTYFSRRQFTLATGKDEAFKVHKMGSALPPHVVQGIDALVLRLFLKKLKAEGIKNVLTVHDDIGTHARDAAKAKELYLEAFREAIEGTTIFQQLYDIIIEQGGEIDEPPALGSYDTSIIPQAVYALG